MEPQLPDPSRGSESRTPGAAPGESRFGAVRGPEATPRPELQGSNEVAEKPNDRPLPNPADIAIPTPPPVPVLDPVVAADPASDVPGDDTPASASDDDLIEKEWVEKAKRVISQTKNDPYEQEKAVGRLQAQYLQKRYNKTVKLPSDE